MFRGRHIWNWTTIWLGGGRSILGLTRSAALLIIFEDHALGEDLKGFKRFKRSTTTGGGDHDDHRGLKLF